MTDQEIMDKFNEFITRIDMLEAELKDELDQCDREINTMKYDMDEVKSDISFLRTDVSSLRY